MNHSVCKLRNSFPNRAGSRQIYHLMQRIIKHFSAIYLVFFVISLTITSQGRSENSDQSGPLHPMLPNADPFSLFAILALSAITISDSILAIDVTLDRQNVHLLCILISTHLLHFMTAEIASILRQCFNLVNYSLSSVGGLHSLSSLV